MDHSGSSGCARARPPTLRSARSWRPTRVGRSGRSRWSTARVGLRRLVNMHRGYQELEAAQNLARAGDFEATMRRIERAYELAPASTEIRFWRASLLAMFGDPRSQAEVDAVIATNPDWGEF